MPQWAAQWAALPVPPVDLAPVRGRLLRECSTNQRNGRSSRSGSIGPHRSEENGAHRSGEPSTVLPIGPQQPNTQQSVTQKCCGGDAVTYSRRYLERRDPVLHLDQQR